MTNAALWWLTLGVGLVVTLVVGVLLVAILRSVRRIAARAGEIWTVGQSVANNTVHLDLLRRSGVMAQDAIASLEHSIQSAQRIRRPGGP